MKPWEREDAERLLQDARERIAKLSKAVQAGGDAVLRAVWPMLDLSRQLAEVHVGDGDELGDIARELLARLNQVRKPES